MFMKLLMVNMLNTSIKFRFNTYLKDYVDKKLIKYLLTPNQGRWFGRILKKILKKDYR